ncbi:MAG: hypothetical protein ABI528_07070 [bacterium]
MFITTNQKKFFFLILFFITFTFHYEDSYSQFQTGNDSASTKKESWLTVGVGGALYDKVSLLVSLDLVGQISNKLYLGVTLDKYTGVGKSENADKLLALSVNLLYKGKIVDRVSYYLGGGFFTLLKGKAAGLNGYVRVEYQLNRSFSLGAAYKQPLSYASHGGKENPRLVEFTLSYRLN